MYLVKFYMSILILQFKISILKIEFIKNLNLFLN